MAQRISVLFSRAVLRLRDPAMQSQKQLVRGDYAFSLTSCRCNYLFDGNLRPVRHHLYILPSLHM